MGVAVYVPETTLREGMVWVCDADSLRAERRDVVSSDVTEGLIRVDSGLRPGEWVIADPSGLREGQRLKPRVTELP
jgi:multidrug efflux pump subunit AcrA (membrane-fusion protein)